MNREALIETDFTPRPKVNRLPPVALYKSPSSLPKKTNKLPKVNIGLSPIKIIIYTLVALLFLLSIIMGYQYIKGMYDNFNKEYEDDHLLNIINNSGYDNQAFYFKDGDSIISGRDIHIVSNNNFLFYVPKSEKNMEKDILTIINRYD
ncbi:MAG: hypothetical protein R3D71_00505 [Rickettsiales bacterium]